MSRIVFVDDEPIILKALSRMLYVHDEWEVLTATTGEAALAHLDAGPVDVIVSDMQMPDMDGVTLLTQVMKKHPRVVRLILSGESELARARNVIPVAHQFLAKPCSGQDLLEVLRGLGGLRALIGQRALQESVGRLGSLPSRPEVYLELTRALEDPEVSIDSLVGIVQRDANITGRILQLANSSFLGAHQRTSSLQQAVSFIGFRMLRDLVMTCEVFRSVGADENAAMEEARVRDGARIAQIIAGRQSDDSLVTAALLRDVGSLIVRRTETTSAHDAVRARIEGGLTQVAAEREIYGYTHAEIGAYLLAVWGMPLSLVEAVLYHHSPWVHSPDSLALAGILRAADHTLDLRATPEGAEWSEETRLTDAYLKTLGHGDEFVEWCEQAGEVLTARAA